MYKFILFLGICSAFASGSKPPEKLQAKHSARLPVTDDKCQKIVGCYYDDYANDLNGETLSIEMIDVSLCTHLFYSVAVLNTNGSVRLVDVHTDIDLNGIQRINNLRKKNRRMKTLLNVQESFLDDNKKNSNKILFNPILREKLANNIVNLVQKYKFNGMLLQPKYQIQENAVASDKQNFVLVLKALKDKFDEKGLILSLAFDARESTAKKYDIKEISKYASFINLMTYNFHEDSNSDAKKILRASHTAPLYHSAKENTEERKLNLDYIVKYWLSQHAPPNKLILGTTSNGIEYHLSNPKQFGRDAPVVTDKTPGDYLPSTNYISTCPIEKDKEWTTFWDKEQQVPYIHKENDMIAYDNVESISIKAEYAKKMKLGGVFVDGIEGDDFSGDCGGGKFPLLKAVNRVLKDKC